MIALQITKKPTKSSTAEAGVPATTPKAPEEHVSEDSVFLFNTNRKLTHMDVSFLHRFPPEIMKTIFDLAYFGVTVKKDLGSKEAEARTKLNSGLSFREHLPALLQVDKELFQMLYQYFLVKGFWTGKLDISAPYGTILDIILALEKFTSIERSLLRNIKMEIVCPPLQPTLHGLSMATIVFAKYLPRSQALVDSEEELSTTSKEFFEYFEAEIHYTGIVVKGEWQEIQYGQRLRQVGTEVALSGDLDYHRLQEKVFNSLARISPGPLFILRRPFIVHLKETYGWVPNAKKLMEYESQPEDQELYARDAWELDVPTPRGRIQDEQDNQAQLFSLLEVAKVEEVHFWY